MWGQGFCKVVVLKGLGLQNVGLRVQRFRVGEVPEPGHGGVEG